MANGIDHVVIGVRGLATASADYAALGFVVTPGGEHAGGATHNALVAFADGAYLELIAFAEPDRPQEHRWWSKMAAGEGLIDVALRADAVATEASRLRAAGLVGDGPQEGGRKRPDGERVAWRNLVVEHPEVSLPFLIEDVTPRSLRVAEGEATQHPNGATGVAGLAVAVADLDDAAAVFAAFLGTDAADAASGPGAARRFSVGPHWLELVPGVAAGEGPNGTSAHRLGPVGLVLRGAAESETTLPLDRTHGARIRISP